MNSSVNREAKSSIQIVFQIIYVNWNIKHVILDIASKKQPQLWKNMKKPSALVFFLNMSLNDNFIIEISFWITSYNEHNKDLKWTIVLVFTFIIEIQK